MNVILHRHLWVNSGCCVQILVILTNGVHAQRADHGQLVSVNGHKTVLHQFANSIVYLKVNVVAQLTEKLFNFFVELPKRLRC